VGFLLFLLGFRLRASAPPHKASAGQGLRRTSVLRVAQSVCCFGVRLRFFCGFARQSFMRRRVFLGCLVWVEVCSEGSYSEVRVIAVFADKVNIYFLLFLCLSRSRGTKLELTPVRVHSWPSLPYSEIAGRSSGKSLDPNFTIGTNYSRGKKTTDVADELK